MCLSLPIEDRLDMEDTDDSLSLRLPRLVCPGERTDGCWASVYVTNRKIWKPFKNVDLDVLVISAK